MKWQNFPALSKWLHKFSFFVDEQVLQFRRLPKRVTIGERLRTVKPIQAAAWPTKVKVYSDMIAI